jgi:xanthosine utilization system XapX-like protein
MGKFVNFFKKIGGGIKKAFNWVKEKIAPVVRKVLPFAKPLVNMIPGYGPSIVKGIEIGERVAPIADKLVNGSANDRINAVNQGIGMITNRMGMPSGAGPKIM